MTTPRGQDGAASVSLRPGNRRTSGSRFRWLRAALLLLIVAAAPLTAAHAQEPQPVFQPAIATATAQAKAAQAQPTQAAGNGDVPVPFGKFTYLLDPTCLDQHYIIGIRTAQDPTTGNDVEYVTLLVFLKDDDGYTVIPRRETQATGPDAGKPLGARLCAGKEGSQ